MIDLHELSNTTERDEGDSLAAREAQFESSDSKNSISTSGVFYNSDLFTIRWAKPESVTEDWKKSSSEKYCENSINSDRIDEFNRKYSSRFVELLREEHFEYGLDSKATTLVGNLFEQNKLATKSWLLMLYYEFSSDICIASGILRTFSNLDPDDVNPEGQILAKSALQDVHTEIQEAGLRALENWYSIDCLPFLKTIRCKEEWLQDYLDSIISDMELLVA
ncbi:MAG: hypothetical protein JKY86_02035 [Gammaproteobacteria bacterium]|nr:hypothetical protein [Gammaproteobacteria bacterium]